MSTAATNAEQNVAAKDEQQSTSETVAQNDASKTENSTDSGAAQEQPQQTGPGPKALRSHFRGMPKQWEKNRQPKKDEE